MNILKDCFLISNKYEQIVVGPFYLMMYLISAKLTRKEIEPPMFPLSSSMIKEYLHLQQDNTGSFATTSESISILLILEVIFTHAA